MTARLRPLAFLILELALAASVAFRLSARERTLATGLIFLAALGLGLALATEFAAHWAGAQPDTRAKLRVLMATSFAMLAALELVLRFGTDRFATYSERNGGDRYESPFEYDRSSWYRVHPPNAEVVSRRREFTHVRRTNQLGLPERDVPQAKRPGEFRIVALGDSFTEGIGAEEPRTWVRVLERQLAARVPGRVVSAMNAGVAGSDVAFEYVLLRDKLLAYRPDLVIVATNPTDAADFSVRGGRERFAPDGTLRAGRPAPRWEWLYAINYVFRGVALLRYDWLFLERSSRPQVERAVIRELGDTLDEFGRLARAGGFRVLVVVHPAATEARLQRWSFGYEHLIERLQGTPDLLVLDLLQRLDQRWTDPRVADALYWPVDGHLNAKGYASMGHAIADAILERGLLRVGYP